MNIILAAIRNANLFRNPTFLFRAPEFNSALETSESVEEEAEDASIMEFETVETLNVELETGTVVMTVFG